MTRRDAIVAEIARLYARLEPASGRHALATLGPPAVVRRIRALAEEHWRLADPDTIGTIAFQRRYDR